MKNQADLQNPCAYKIRRIYKIPASTEKQADLQNPCAYRKTGRFTESLRAVEIPAPGKKPAGLEKLATRLLFRLCEISSC
jgi:hypothetical protein